MKKLLLSLAILLASLPLVAQHTSDEFPWDFFIPNHTGHLVLLYDAYDSYERANMYMWGDVNNLDAEGGETGYWPGWSPFVSLVGFRGYLTHFFCFDIPAACTGLTENLIFNNEGNGYQANDVVLTIGGPEDISVYVLTDPMHVEEVTDLDAFFFDYFYDPVNPRDPLAYDPANPADPTRPSEDDPIIPTALDDASLISVPRRVLAGSRVCILRDGITYDLLGNRVK